MKRTLYVYSIDVQPVSEKKVLNLESLEDDFITVITKLCQQPIMMRKQDCKREKKIIYLDEYEYIKENGIINLKFISAKYDCRRKVIDTETLEDKGILKKVNDGDEEKNHVCIKFLEDNTAFCLYETNIDGIGFRKIMHYLEKCIKNYHRSKKDGCYYNLPYANIVSKDFLLSLNKIQKIKAVTLTIDQKDVNVSDFKELSGTNDISSDYNIVLKPASVIGIQKNTVKKFFAAYNSKNKIIKKVTVNGDGESKEPIQFDTEKMKEKIIIEVSTGETGEVNTRDIFDIMFTEILGL